MRYSMRMLRFTVAKQQDLPSVMKLFRRVNESLLLQGIDMWNNGYPDEQIFADDISQKHLFIAKDGAIPVTSAAVSFDLKEAFFEETKSEAKVADLLDKVHWKGENVLVLHRLMVDPRKQGKGIAVELLRYIETLYPHRLWIFCAYIANPKAVAFYEKHGFVNAGPYLFEYGPYSRQILFYKRP
jgi:GNAT superfamily N-acetyltransferase